MSRYGPPRLDSTGDHPGNCTASGPREHFSPFHCLLRQASLHSRPPKHQAIPTQPPIPRSISSPNPTQTSAGVRACPACVTNWHPADPCRRRPLVTSHPSQRSAIPADREAHAVSPIRGLHQFSLNRQPGSLATTTARSPRPVVRNPPMRLMQPTPLDAQERRQK